MASKHAVEELEHNQTDYTYSEVLRVQNLRLQYRFWLLVIILSVGFIAFVIIVSGVAPPLIMYCHHHNNNNCSDVSSPNPTKTYNPSFFHCVGFDSTECETDCRCGWCMFASSDVETGVCLSMDYQQHCQDQPSGAFISVASCPGAS